MTTIPTLAELLDARTDEMKFAAIEVARILAGKARQPLSAEDQQALAQLREVQPPSLPGEAGLAVAQAAIRIAANEPELAPLLHEAIQDYAASKKQLVTTILAAGTVLTLAMFVAKCQIKRDRNGAWTFEHKPIGDAAIIEVAKAVREVAEAANKVLKLIPASGKDQS